MKVYVYPIGAELPVVIEAHRDVTTTATTVGDRIHKMLVESADGWISIVGVDGSLIVRTDRVAWFEVREN